MMQIRPRSGRLDDADRVVGCAGRVVPGAARAWQWDQAAPGGGQETHQIVIVPNPVDPAAGQPAEQHLNSPEFGPVIITYHDIGRRPSPYTVTPEEFAVQMRTIHEAGWSTLTAAQIVAWMHGGRCPHSVMITFDDGAKGVWQYADPILATTTCTPSPTSSPASSAPTSLIT